MKKTVSYTQFASVVWFLQISIVYLQYALDTNKKYLLWKKFDLRQLHMAFLLPYKHHSLHPYTVYGITNDKCVVSKHSNMSEIKLDQIFLVISNLTHKFFSMYLFIYSSLHVSSMSCSSSGETNYINTVSGNCHSVLVAVPCAGWE